MKVRVAYAGEHEGAEIAVDVDPPCTLSEAIAASGILQRFPEIDLSRDAVGVWYRRRPPDTLLQDGDRVEIYRPLKCDPKQARRRRASGSG